MPATAVINMAVDGGVSAVVLAVAVNTLVGPSKTIIANPHSQNVPSILAILVVLVVLHCLQPLVCRSTG